MSTVVAAMKAAADHSISKTASLPTALKYAYADDPTDNIKLLSKSIASSVSATEKASADQSQSKTVPQGRYLDVQLVVAGAVWYQNGSYGTETTAAQNATANDMHLLAAAPVLQDAYYFGFNYLWDELLLNIGTSGAGTWVITWEYWNGAWTALSGVTDHTNAFKAATGIQTVTWTRPGDWATTTINSVGPMYFIRARLSSYTSITTEPLGTQAWSVQTTH
jgi:hypothetical protein